MWLKSKVQSTPIINIGKPRVSSDYRVESPENQRKCILPMNSISETIFYNQRIILSAPIKEPVCWRITKVEQISPKGINRLTFAQDRYDQHKDAFEYSDGTFSKEYDADKQIVGMWADYYSSSVLPKDHDEPTPSTIYSVITCSGKQEIKVGGSYKKLIVEFFDGEESAAFQTGQWQFYVNDELIDVSILGTELENQIKIKFTEDDSYIGKNLTIKYVSDEGITSSLDVAIVSM